MRKSEHAAIQQREGTLEAIEILPNQVPSVLDFETSKLGCYDL